MTDFSDRLKLARERAGYATAGDAIEKLSLNQSTYYGHENGDRRPRTDTIREYARLYNVPADWLADGGPAPAQSVSIGKPAPNASAPVPVSMGSRTGQLLPVYGVAKGGPDGRFAFNGEVLDRVPRPPILLNVPDAYCVFVDGESMEPRYFAGEVVYVHPHKPVKRGAFVVVQLKATADGEVPEGYVKQFVGYAGTDLVLKQFNPAGEIRFRAETVESVHRIVLSGDDA